MKLETLLGIGLRKISQGKEPVLEEIDDFWGTELKNILENPKNYEYDCQIAMALLAGEKFAPQSNPVRLFDSEIYPMEERISKGIRGEEVTHSTWCSALQDVLMEKDVMEKMQQVESKNILNFFSYCNMVRIHHELNKNIEQEIKEKDSYNEKRLAEDEKERLKWRAYWDKRTTENETENFYLEDIMFGNSFSIMLYHWVKSISHKHNLPFKRFMKIIHSLADLKCYQLRNIVADLILYRINREEQWFPLIRDYDEFLDRLKQLVQQINGYYSYKLQRKWSEIYKELKEIAPRARTAYIHRMVNSLGTIFPNADSADIIVESFASTIKILYTTELENDIRDFYKINYYKRDDNKRMMLGDLIEISLTENLDYEVNVHLGKENISVSEIEENEKDEVEKAKKINDIHNNLRIMKNPTVLFTLIHVEVAKTYLRKAR